MPLIGKRFDLLTDDLKIQERVRLLEIMGQSRTLQPKLWQPNRDQLDALTGYTVLASAMDNLKAEGVLPPRVGPTAQYLWAICDRDGMSMEVATQMFMLWTRCMAQPKHHFASLYWEYDTISYTALAARYPGAFTAPTPGDPDEGLPFISVTAADKMFVFIGIPAGQQWVWKAGGETVIAYETIPVVGGTLLVGTEDVWSVPQGLLYDSSTIGELWDGSRNNVYQIFSGLTFDCGAPGLTLYHGGFGQFGSPNVYDGGPTPCPDNEIGALEVGDIQRVWLSLPLEDLQMLTQPVLIPGQTGGVAPLFDYPGFDILRGRLEDALPEFPAVQAWLSTYVPVALAAQAEARHANWQSLAVYPPWRGRIQVSVREHEVLLRGQAYTVSPDPNVGESIAHWPLNLPHGRLNLEGTLLQCHYTGGLHNNKPVNVQINHVVRETTDTGHNGSFLRIHGPRPIIDQAFDAPLTINFDGARFPI